MIVTLRESKDGWEIWLNNRLFHTAYSREFAENLILEIVAQNTNVRVERILNGHA